MSSVFLTGDPARTFYSPNGILSVSGGVWREDELFPGFPVWHPWDPGADYNFSIMHGRPFERPASFEILRPETTEVAFRTTLGVRFAGSPWSRPRQTMQELDQGAWSRGWQNKPQMNIHFRDDLGAETLQQGGFIPGSPAEEWDSLRLRAGKNDPYNPFIIDEFMRRLYFRMGHHPSPQGFFANLFINGQWKGHYNVTERPREKFFQEFYGSGNDWDVNYVGSFENGDRLAYDAMMEYFLTHDFSTDANYQTGKTHWDEVNVADYFLINSWAATSDWPGNNFACTRERAPGAQWRYTMWDAEGAFGTFGQSRLHNTLDQQLLIPENGSRSPRITEDTYVARLIFRRFCQNAEFRLLCADRIQRQFFNGGPLATEPLTGLYGEIKNRMAAGLQAAAGAEFNDSFWKNWLQAGGGRTATFLTQARTAGLWPATRAPGLTPFGGGVAAGGTATLSNPNSSGVLYYTTDGTDPRAVGGAVQGAAYTGSVVIGKPTRLKARVLRGGEWSPLTEADFAPPPPRLLFTEIHYHPPDADGETEFLEITNTGDGPVSLDGAHFTEGIEFTFANGVSLAAGASVVIVRDAAAFAAAYPGVETAGAYSGALSNSGETLTLRDLTGSIILTVTYGDANTEGWPAEADGRGASLVLKQPLAHPPPDPGMALNWRRSARNGGNPGGTDSTSFAGPEPLADGDQDGWCALLEYAFATSDNDPAAVPVIEHSPHDSGRRVLTLTTNPAADDLLIECLQSPDPGLDNWSLMLQDDLPQWMEKGLVTVWRTQQPVSVVPRLFMRARVRLR